MGEIFIFLYYEKHKFGLSFIPLHGYDSSSLHQIERRLSHILPVFIPYRSAVKVTTNGATLRD